MISSIPTIDYDAHPAFAGLGVKMRGDEDDLNRLMDEIDDSYNHICEFGDWPLLKRHEEMERIVVPKFQQLTDRVVASEMTDEFASYARIAMGIALDTMRHGLDARKPQGNSEVMSLPPSLPPFLAAFRRDGFCEFDTNRKVARKIWSATWIERALLRARAKNTPNKPTNAISLHRGSQAARVIDRAIRANGLVDVASAYMRKPMEVLYYALEYNQPRQTWYRDCYADVGISTSSTAYMHFDADYDVLKAMIYLSEVDEKSGPFSYIPGSHLWARSILENAVRNGFDQAQWTVFRWEDESRYYYRPRFNLPNQRANTLALPKRLRGSTHFGDDILDGSDLSHALLGAEHSFQGPPGTTVLFDGSQGVHRGGLVRDHDRWVIQIALRAKGPHNVAPTIKSKLKKRLGYLKFAVTSLADPVLRS